MRMLKQAPLIVVLLVTGCDSFTLMDQFQLPKSNNSSTGSLALAVQTPTLQQNGTTLLVPSGGTAPYTYADLADSLSYTGTMGTFGTSPVQYTAGTSIGTIKVRVIDNIGNTADAVVTVLPPAPTSFAAAYTAPPTPKTTISWNYPDTAFIPNGYILQSSTTGAAASYTQLTTLANTATSYVQNGGGANGTYYRLYAVSGAYQSLPVVVQSQ